jgi:hypothetical protein
MRALDDAALVALWERGAPLHPLDRALVLCAAARADVPPARLADLPLGEVNRALLEVRRASFGPHLGARVSCERCGAALEMARDADALAAGLATPAAVGADADDLLRAPTMRDLAAVAGEANPAAAALALARRCAAVGDCDASLEEIERRLEALDPAADVALDVTCDACGHAWPASLDLGAFLWTEVTARARAVIADVDRLARAYGWTEREVLGLSPQRRAAYLELCSA